MPAYVYPDSGSDQLLTKSGIQTIVGAKTFDSASLILTNSNLFQTNAGYYINTTYNGGTMNGVIGLATPSPSVGGIIIRSSASQTANLSEWQNSAGTILGRVTAGGSFNVGIGVKDATLTVNIDNNNLAGFAVTSWADGIPAIVARGRAAQTGSLQEWQNSAGTTLARVNSAGGFSMPLVVFSDNGASRGGIYSPDTRNVNDAPGMFNQILRTDFKADSTIGLPTTGGYNGLMTFAPWGDDSGGGVFQLAFTQSNNAASSATGGGTTPGNIWMRYGTRSGGWRTWRPLSVADEGWTMIGTAGAPGWLNGWTNYGPGYEVGFRKLSNGMIVFRGLARSGTINAPMFNLPVGYRPINHTYHVTQSHNGSQYTFGTLTTYPNGEVRVTQSPDVNQVSLWPITYYAEG